MAVTPLHGEVGLGVGVEGWSNTKLWLGGHTGTSPAGPPTTWREMAAEAIWSAPESPCCGANGESTPTGPGRRASFW